MARFRDPPKNRQVSDEEGFVDEDWFRYFLAITSQFSAGVSTTVQLAKLTGGGTNGSLTIVNGLITDVINPT